MSIRQIKLLITHIVKLFLFFLLFLFPLRTSIASPGGLSANQAFEKVRGYYFTLRKMDPELKNLARLDEAAPVIVIDPGHGGLGDLGAVGVGGILEKDIVLNIALYLDELLRERLRAKTVLTRARDVELSLARRTEIANNSKADLFISIHANASLNKKASGVETYYLDNTNDKSSQKLAKRENSAYNVGADDLQFILSDLIQNAKLADSISLAHNIQNTLIARVSRYYKKVNDLGVKKAPFYVLVGAHMPCVLVEVSFIDHHIEGKRLARRRYQKLIAEALYRGIKSYFERHDAPAA